MCDGNYNNTCIFPLECLCESMLRTHPTSAFIRLCLRKIAHTISRLISGVNIWWSKLAGFSNTRMCDGNYNNTCAFSLECLSELMLRTHPTYAFIRLCLRRIAHTISRLIWGVNIWWNKLAGFSNTRMCDGNCNNNGVFFIWEFVWVDVADAPNIRFH